MHKPVKPIVKISEKFLKKRPTIKSQSSMDSDKLIFVNQYVFSAAKDIVDPKITADLLTLSSGSVPIVAEISGILLDWDYKGFNPLEMASRIVKILDSVPDKSQRSKIIHSICGLAMMQGNKINKIINRTESKDAKDLLIYLKDVIGLVDKQTTSTSITLTRFAVSFSLVSFKICQYSIPTVQLSLKKIDQSLVPDLVESIWHHPHIVMSCLNKMIPEVSDVCAFYSDLKGYILSSETSKKTYKANHFRNLSFVKAASNHFNTMESRTESTKYIFDEAFVGLWFYSHWEETPYHLAIANIYSDVNLILSTKTSIVLAIKTYYEKSNLKDAFSKTDIQSFITSINQAAVE